MNKIKNNKLSLILMSTLSLVFCVLIALSFMILIPNKKLEDKVFASGNSVLNQNWLKTSGLGLSDNNISKVSSIEIVTNSNITSGKGIKSVGTNVYCKVVFNTNDEPTSIILYTPNNTIYLPENSNGIFCFNTDDKPNHNLQITQFDVTKFDVSNVKNSTSMFRNCTKLTSLNLSSWDTSKFENASYMFYNCISLTNLNISGFNFANVKNMSYMFLGIPAQIITGIENLNTNNVTTFEYLFCNASNLQTLNLSSWNTSNVTNMAGVFLGCTSLTSINLSGWDTSKVLTMKYMFAGPGGFDIMPGYLYYDKIVGDIYKGNILYSGSFSAMAVRQIDGLENFNTRLCKDMTGMFQGCRNMNWLQLLSIVASFDKTNLDYLAYIFAGIDITEFDMSSLGDVSHVRFFGGFFAGSKVTSIKLTFDTSTSQTFNCCSYMFAGCPNLKTIDITGFNSSKVFNMGYMFAGCPQLEEIIGLENLDTGYVYNMSYMFAATNLFEEFDVNATFTNLTRLNDLGWHEDRREYDALEGMFAGSSSPTGNFKFIFDSSQISRRVGVNGLFMCSEYINIDITELNTTNINSISLIFSYCPNLTSLNNIVGLSQLDTSNINDMSYMFAGTKMFNSANDQITTFSFEDVFEDIKNLTNIEGMFSQITATKFKIILNTELLNDTINIANLLLDCENLNQIDLSELNTANVNNISNMYGNCKALTTLNIDHFRTTNMKSMAGMFANCITLENISMRNAQTGNVEDMSFMFYNCKKLQNLYIRNFATENTKLMNDMFNGCLKIVELDIRSFDTSKVTNMSSMFSNCSSLERINISSKFNTSKVTNMSYMFNGCSKLTAINLNYFNTSNVTNMEAMFCNCSSFARIDVSNFTTSKVTNMSYMFNGCSALTSLNLTSFNTQNNNYFGAMFNNCTNLESIEFGNYFKTDRAYSMASMFSNCRKLAEIDWTNFKGNSVSNISYMFYNCVLLEEIDLSKYNLSSISSVNAIKDFMTGCSSVVSISLPTVYPIMRSDEALDYGNLNGKYYVYGVTTLTKGTYFSDFTDYVSEDSSVRKIVKFSGLEDCNYQVNILTFASSIFNVNVIVDFDDTTKQELNIIAPINFTLRLNDPNFTISTEYMTINRDGGIVNFSVKKGVEFEVTISLLKNANDEFNVALSEYMISINPVSNLPTMQFIATGDENIDLFITQIYTITASLKNSSVGRIAVSSQKVLHGGETYNSFVATENFGYRFVDWSKENENDNIEIVSPKSSQTKVKSVYQNANIVATIEVQIYHIILKIDGREEIIQYDINSEAIKLYIPTKFGYDFEGWTGSNGNMPQKEIVIAKGSYGDREYIANWKPDQRLINIIIITIVSVIIFVHMLIIAGIILYKRNKRNKQVITISLENLKRK